MCFAGCTGEEYVDLLHYGWFGPQCLCDVQPNKNPKQYRTTSTSTQPSTLPNACTNCDVPRRISSPRNNCVKPSTSLPCDTSHGHVHGMVARLERDRASSDATGEFVAVSGPHGLYRSCGTGSPNRMPMTFASDQYCTMNPCYKSSTPPEDIAVAYPILLQPLSLLEATPASMPSLQDYARPDVIPPRSSTAPNVRGLEDITESLAHLHTHSPRSSWAGPSHSTSSPGSPGQVQRRRHDPCSGKWPIYDEVYIPHVTSPDPPARSSSLASPQTRVKRSELDLNVKSRSHIPRLDSLRPSASSPRLQQRSVSQHTVHMGTSSLKAASQKGYQASTPSLYTTETAAATGGMMPHTPSPIREVWIPQIPPQQSASFTGQLLSGEEAKAGNRLSQSCEQLTQQSKRTKRRVPTPPRVLSPSMEDITCKPIADI